MAKYCKSTYTKVWRKNYVGLIKGLVPKNTRIWKKISIEKPRTEAFQTSKDNKSEHKELEDHEKPSI